MLTRSGEWRRHQASKLISDGKLVIGDGYRAKNEELSNRGIPFARAGNINDGFHFAGADHFPESNLHRVGNKASEPGDVVFTSKGTVGRFGFVRPDTPRFVYSPQLCFWRSVDHDLINPRFLYYWMFGREFYVQFKGVAGQTDMAEYVSLTDQRRMTITLPPRDEQCAIATILGALDDKIELNRRMNQTLEAMAQALFQSWFVDFDPVRAKMEGRQPAGMDAETAALFPDKLELSTCGLTPTAWTATTLGSTIELIGGGTPSTSVDAYWGGQLPWFAVTDAPRDGDVFVLDTEKHITEQGLANSSTRMLPPLTTIISARGTVGKCALTAVSMAMNQTCYGVRGREGRGDYFTYFAIRAVVADLKRNTHGSVFDTITRATFTDVRTAAPPITLTQRFDRVAGPYLRRIAANLRESLTLAVLRDILLPKLLSGELRVPEAREMVVAAC